MTNLHFSNQLLHDYLMSARHILALDRKINRFALHDSMNSPQSALQQMTYLQLLFEQQREYVNLCAFTKFCLDQLDKADKSLLVMTMVYDQSYQKIKKKFNNFCERTFYRHKKRALQRFYACYIKNYAAWNIPNKYIVRSA